VNISNAVMAPTKKHLDDSDFSKYFLDKKYVIPYPLNIAIKKVSCKKENGRKIIFSCGRLIYYKGFEVLIEVAKYLSDEFIIHIAGDGPLYNKLLKKIKKHSLLDKVKLLGRLSDEEIAVEFEQCFAFCLPSVERSEMFGVVQVEAFCRGKPVISTNIPCSGVSEVNKNGITGYVVEIKNPQAIAEKIRLLNNDVLYNDMCSNALCRGKKLTDPKIINQYINLFDVL
jgi:glycosyltransferase involved in cell wall biosynthesis